MKNLYISDLDGTLLNEHAELSDFAKAGIKQIIGAGINFTFATARSVKSVQQIFSGIQLLLPVIEFNGAFISDLGSGKHLEVNAIENNLYGELLNRYKQQKRNFFLSSYDGKEDRLNYQQAENDGDNWYIISRIKNKDPRLRQVSDIFKIRNEEIICFTFIDTYENLEGEFIELQKMPGVEIHLQENRYSPGWFWLTVHSEKATKDRAISRLKEITGLDSCLVTVFGDNTNDIKMMKNADTAVAVANAKEEVKAIADTVIGVNTDNAVVKYILEREGLALPEGAGT